MSGPDCGRHRILITDVAAGDFQLEFAARHAAPPVDLIDCEMRAVEHLRGVGGGQPIEREWHPDKDRAPLTGRWECLSLS